ncbi:hypothetical protein BU25DRAFT_240138 [Macroventuria anomochaeta]|uniref:Uncharacterized protein n=1 Tax=Macroventuria anomochaeta TaxID=301207 RepID=A0ACB6RHX7_9PLEO|nr:uncharacterized protein BU25DRAFT_240138 [Macroventuria anomochaeta]KAF2621302.1 hypothetical protein BU25DRAFT_240138 [Macroventuria anomochaeta]
MAQLIKFLHAQIHDLKLVRCNTASYLWRSHMPSRLLSGLISSFVRIEFLLFTAPSFQLSLMLQAPQNHLPGHKIIFHRVMTVFAVVLHNGSKKLLAQHLQPPLPFYTHGLSSQHRSVDCHIVADAQCLKIIMERVTSQNCGRVHILEEFCARCRRAFQRIPGSYRCSHSVEGFRCQLILLLEL